MRRLAALVALLVALVGTPTPAQAEGRSAGRSAWVSVAVARLWESPTSPRAVDDPALAAPVRFRSWLAAMSLSERRALSFHSDTEALLGERVVVTGVRGAWAHVVVPDQPSQKDPRGYPGWVPLRQITYTAPPSSGPVASVVRRTAWLRTDTGSAAKVIEVSYGTVLPVVSRDASLVRVRTPLGAVRRVAAAAVVVHPRGTSARPRTGTDLVRSAQSFTGLPYLWGGLSGFGLDCSGLTWVDYRVHGRVIPRDALPQSRAGRFESRSALAKGDLIFYATNGLVHHVTMYAGNGRMIEAPHTGSVVRTVPVRSTEYFGARRYLG